jgi:anaerobic magnesium-protoporphyrin IX monomethyl ester cyclase
MNGIDCLIVASSETVQYEQYSKLPLERIELYRNLVQLRMVYFDGGFHSTLDIFNKIIFNKYFFEADYPERRKLLSIWNIPALNAVLALNPLLHKGINCKIINNFDAEFDILASVAQTMEKPIICISTTFILQWSEIGRICKKIRQAVPKAILVLGGAFLHDQFLMSGASGFEKHMRKFGINYVLFSYNSEIDLANLFFAVKNKTSVKKVTNLAYIDEENNFFVTEEQWNLPELDTLPIHWEKISRSYPPTTLQLRTSVGCPFRCAFCNYSTIARKYSLSDIRNVRQQLDTINNLGSVEALIFVDDNLNVPKKRFRELLNVLKRYHFRWYAFLRVQFVDEIIASEMRESGCDGVYLGLESGCDELLENMNKKATIKEYQQGIDLLKENDITTFASFIIGFPGESGQTIARTTEFIENSGLNFYSAKEWYYLKTSSIHSQCGKYGLSGEGNVWTHATMNSVQASTMKLKIFEEVKRPIHVDPDMGLWCLAYLRDRGFTWSQISSSLKIINEMMSRENRGKWTEKNDCIQNLKKVILRTD